MLKMTFESGRGPIDVTITDRHFGNGEAYFRRDDMFAAITEGIFRHPMLNIEYRVLLPTHPSNRSSRSKAVLETHVWNHVAESAVFDATPGS